MHSTCNKILVASVRERILLWSERLFFSSSLVDELDKKIPHGRIFFLIPPPPSVKYATTPGRKVNRGYLERCLSLISAQEAWDKSTFFDFTTNSVAPPTLPHPGWLMCCWDGSSAMCAGISRGLCGSHTLDIPIETVKNRWSLGVDTMKQISEPSGGGDNCWSCQSLTETVINDIFHFNGGEWASDRSIINERRVVGGDNGSLLAARRI